MPQAVGNLFLSSTRTMISRRQVKTMPKRSEHVSDRLRQAAKLVQTNEVLHCFAEALDFMPNAIINHVDQQHLAAEVVQCQMFLAANVWVRGGIALESSSAIELVIKNP